MLRKPCGMNLNKIKEHCSTFKLPFYLGRSNVHGTFKPDGREKQGDRRDYDMSNLVSMQSSHSYQTSSL